MYCHIPNMLHVVNHWTRVATYCYLQIGRKTSYTNSVWERRFWVMWLMKEDNARRRWLWRYNRQLVDFTYKLPSTVRQLLTALLMLSNCIDVGASVARSDQYYAASPWTPSITCHITTIFLCRRGFINEKQESRLGSWILPAVTTTTAAAAAASTSIYVYIPAEALWRNRFIARKIEAHAASATSHLLEVHCSHNTLHRLHAVDSIILHVTRAACPSSSSYEVEVTLSVIYAYMYYISLSRDRLLHLPLELDQYILNT